MDSKKRWNEPNGIIVRVPLYLLANRSLEDQSLAQHAYQHAYMQMQELNNLDEHAQNPGVGAADSYCVFHMGGFESEEDDE